MKEIELEDGYYNQQGSHVSCQQQLHLAAYLCRQKIRHRVRATPETLVCDAQIQYEVDRPRSVGEISHQLVVSTPLTPAPGHLLFLTLVVV